MVFLLNWLYSHECGTTLSCIRSVTDVSSAADNNNLRNLARQTPEIKMQLSELLGTSVYMHIRRKKAAFAEFQPAICESTSDLGEKRIQTSSNRTVRSEMVRCFSYGAFYSLLITIFGRQL